MMAPPFESLPSDLSLRLSHIQKKETDGGKIETFYDEIMKEVDADTALKIHTLCPKLKPKLEGDASRIIQKCWRDVEAALSSSIILDQHGLRSSIKIMMHLWEFGDADGRPSVEETESTLLSLLDHADLLVDSALVVGMEAVKFAVRQSDPQDRGNKCRELFMSKNTGSLAKISLTEGILGASLSLLDEKALFEPCREAPLIKELTDFVTSMCKIPSSYSFHCFHCLKGLTIVLSHFAKMDKTVKSSEYEQFFNPNSQFAQELLSVINSNWENPTKGVSDLVGLTFAALLEAFQASGHEETIRRDLFLGTWKSLGWRSKPKFASLEVLLTTMGCIEDVLDGEPEIGFNMGESLVSNYLASAGAAVYKLLVKKISFQSWEKHLRQPLLQSLVSDQDLVSTNACNQWLSATVKAYKQPAVESLVHALLSQGVNMSHKSWTSVMLVLKASRQVGLEDYPQARDQIAKALNHVSPVVRGAAFSALCLTKKRGSPPTPSEMDLITEFTVANLAVDSPAFRQNFLGDLSVGLIRCRDFLVNQIRQHVKKDKNLANFCDSYVLKKLDVLLESVFANCFPGANYQRLTTALAILELFSSSFFHFQPGKGVNKSSGNGDPTVLLEYCVKAGIFQLDTPKHYDILFSCVLHHMTDVRRGALSLLSKFHAPEKDVLTAVVTKGFSLMSSPKFAECESGAVLLRLVSTWMGNNMCEVVKESAEPFPMLSAALCDGIEKMTMSEILLGFYIKNLAVSQNDFLMVAKTSPMHGMLTALRACLEHDILSVPSDFPNMATSVLKESCNVMLTRLSSKESSADFFDMAEAVEAICETDASGVEISDEHQLVLACAWHNLKECCLLANLLVKLGMSESRFEFAVQDVEKCCAIVIEVLTRCRHKGAIIAAQNSMMEISSTLLKCHDFEFREIPREILTKTLDQLEDELSGASMTRRSAGLPMLVLKVVSGEAKGNAAQDGLTSLAVKRLVCTANKKVPDGVNEIKDAPQAHALHILRALVHDAGLAGATSAHIPVILKCCLDNFHVRLWSVRNAALQLFGSLAPRMLGQKKVREEGSACNALTATEFLSRHQQSARHMLAYLGRSNLSDLSREFSVNPHNVPILSILCRLTPSGSGIGESDLLVARFRLEFFALLASSVAQERVLAAKAFAAFTRPNHLLPELNSILERLCGPVTSANFTNGLLHASNAIVPVNGKDCKVENALLVKAAETLQRRFPKCYENKVLLLRLFHVLGQTPIQCLICETKSEVKVHPGFRRWKELYSPDLGGDARNPDAHEDLADGRTKDPEGLVQELGEHLEIEVVDRQFVSRRLEMVLRCPDRVLCDGAVALDLLDAATEVRLCEKDDFSSTASLSLKATALAFAAMMTQADWSMFFGADESQYVSFFVEFSERLGRFASPFTDGEVDEDNRMSAAEAVSLLIPIFRQHHLKDLPPLLRYGFVNVCNALLELLTDEDEEVRNAATEAASKLAQSRTGQPANVLPTSKAVEELVAFGLRELGDCSNWFQPVVDVLLVPWRDDVKGLQQSPNRQYLFESGDGVNVYAEKVNNSIVYHKMLREHLEHDAATAGDLVSLGINLDRVRENATSLIDMVSASTPTCYPPFSALWSSKGYLVLTSMRNLLDLICDFGPKLGVKPEDIERLKLAQLKGDLEALLMHTCDVKS